MGSNGQVDHIALRVNDISWYISFFSKAFGMEVTKMVGEKSNPLQVWIDGGIQLISDPDFRSEGSALAHIALAVKDVSATVSSVKDLGGFSQANGDNWMELPDGLCLEILHT